MNEMDCVMMDLRKNNERLTVLQNASDRSLADMVARSREYGPSEELLDEIERRLRLPSNVVKS